MKNLYHPGIPCNQKQIQEELETTICESSDDSLEIVECNKGFGVFGENWFWATKEEIDLIKNSSKVQIQYFEENEKFSHDGWYFYNPIELGIELTRNCNQTCIHCWNESSLNNSQFSLKKAKEIVKEFRDYKGQKLKIMGGEPLVYPSLDEFLSFSKEQGIRKIELTTNGTLINKKKANTLAKYLTEIHVSIHGSTSNIHEDITKNYESFIGIINAINHLQDSGLNPVINYTVMPQNKEDIIDIMKLSKKLNVKRLRINLLRNIGRAENLETISREEIKIFRNLIYYKSKELNVKMEKSELYPSGYSKEISQAEFYGCNGLRSLIYISSNGRVYPCSLINESIGNIYQNSLDKLWKNKKAEDFRKWNKCITKECDISKDCGGKCKANWDN